MTERRSQAGSDGVCWSCSICKTTKSINGSFFSKSKLPLQKWLLALLWWAREFPVTDFADEAEISEHTACDIYQWLREVCSTKLLQSPVVLGGPGVVVQMTNHNFATSLRYKNIYIFFYHYHYIVNPHHQCNYRKFNTPQ